MDAGEFSLYLIMLLDNEILKCILNMELLTNILLSISDLESETVYKNLPYSVSVYLLKYPLYMTVRSTICRRQIFDKLFAIYICCFAKIGIDFV